MTGAGRAAGRGRVGAPLQPSATAVKADSDACVPRTATCRPSRENGVARLATVNRQPSRTPPPSRGVLNGKKKSVPEPVFPKKPAGTPYVQPWLVAVGGWQLATGGWWRLVVVGGGWWLAVGGWRRLAVVGSWRLVAAGGWRRLVAGGWWRLVVGGWWRLVVGGWWRLAVDGSWRLAVGGPLGRSLRAVLSKKKKISSLKDPPGTVTNLPASTPPPTASRPDRPAPSPNTTITQLPTANTQPPRTPRAAADRQWSRDDAAAETRGEGPECTASGPSACGGGTGDL